MSRMSLLLLVLGLGVVAAWAWFKWFQMYNSPDGERYRRRRTQGPFVPLSAEEIEEDQQRIRSASKADSPALPPK
jgi:hypothetical protein